MTTPRLVQPSPRFFLLNFPAINDGLVYSECVKIVNALRERPDPDEREPLAPISAQVDTLQQNVDARRRMAETLAAPLDPRTLEQINLDEWQKEVSDTRESDRPY